MEKKAEEEIRANIEGTPKVAKKPYASPQLTEYGNVEKLTQSTAVSDAGGQSGRRMTCL